MPPQPQSLPQALQDGVLACRRGDWRTGLNILTQLAQESAGEKALPGIFYSYLGVAMARVEGRKRESIELCRYGVQLAPRDPENRLNLARAYLINRNRHQAIKQLHVGLRISPSNRRLRELEREIGTRRPPAIRFLSRDNPLNMWIGRLTYRWEKARQEREEFERDEAEIERLAGGE